MCIYALASAHHLLTRWQWDEASKDNQIVLLNSRRTAQHKGFGSHHALRSAIGMGGPVYFQQDD